MPDDGLTRTVTFSNNYMTLPVNTYKNFFVDVNIEYNEGFHRTEKIIYSHNSIENINNAALPIFYTSIDGVASIEITNNTYTNISASQGIEYIQTRGSVLLKNNSFTASTSFGSYITNFVNCASVSINYIQISDIIGSGIMGSTIF